MTEQTLLAVAGNFSSTWIKVTSRQGPSQARVACQTSFQVGVFYCLKLI